MRVSVVSPTVTVSPLRGRETHGFIATVSVGRAIIQQGCEQLTR